MSELVGGAGELGGVVLKGVLLFVVAVVGLRTAQRRTLGELDVHDLVATVATGAILGRTVTAHGTSFLTGACALVVILSAHRVLTVLQRMGVADRLLTRRPIALVAGGHVRHEGVARAQLSQRDLDRVLRQAGVADVTQVAAVLYEERGAVTVVPADQALRPVYRRGLEEAGVADTVRGRRGDLIKIIWWDGQGACLFSKRLEKGRFVWPSAKEGKIALTAAQLAMLLEGIDWRLPQRREKRAKDGDVLRGGISWRCSDAVNSLQRKVYATCQRLPLPRCLIHPDVPRTL